MVLPKLLQILLHLGVLLFSLVSSLGRLLGYLAQVLRVVFNTHVEQITALRFFRHVDDGCFDILDQVGIVLGKVQERGVHVHPRDEATDG